MISKTQIINLKKTFLAEICEMEQLAKVRMTKHDRCIKQIQNNSSLYSSNNLDDEL